ncbi:DUF1360 domain-containing protein [Streptomyces sp. cg35]|uniref:DUF1360 domain-containing protein n=1 Tax=Streptomyces sp. cg35 TaxID=3421650 RepID=UPI003D176C7B
MTITLWAFFLVTLGAARITRLVTTDTIAAPVRDRFAARALASYKADLAQAGDDKEAREALKPVTERGLYAGLTCAWCVGFWAVLVAYVIVHLLTHWPDTALGWFAAAAQVLAASWLVGALNTRYAR